MILKVQKRLAGQILNCSPKRITFNPDRLDDIKQAITKRDLRLLIGDGAITRKPVNAISKVRVRKLKIQKSKGRRKGPGSRKGSFNARVDIKGQWMDSVRVQRRFIKELVDKMIIDRKSYRKLYLMSKGGYFRSKRHIKLYLEEHDEMLVKNSKAKLDALAEKNKDNTKDSKASNAEKRKSDRRNKV